MGLGQPVTDQHFRTSLERYTAYAYETIRPVQSLSLQAGLTYDQLRYPQNIDILPITTREDSAKRLSPKFGFQFTPVSQVNFRGAYSRSLGGAFNENTYRLEPTQMAGFNQSLRSILPESVTGLVPASRLENRNLALDLTFKTGTFISLEGAMLNSAATRTLGALSSSRMQPLLADRPGSTPQALDYEEKSLYLTVNQLLGTEWSVGAQGRVSQADFRASYPGVSGKLAADAIAFGDVPGDSKALLYQVNLNANYNHRSGFFAQWVSIWTAQENSGAALSRSSSDFWQHSVYAGYRFAKRHAELRVGLVNLANQNYQLNPLNLSAELPRERTVTVGLKLNF